MTGLFNKYKIEKTDGTPIDPKAKYFVLRLDTDLAARAAVRRYIECIWDTNEDLALDLSEQIDAIVQQIQEAWEKENYKGGEE